jgi:uncharacterized protein YggE
MKQIGKFAIPTLLAAGTIAFVAFLAVTTQTGRPGVASAQTATDTPKSDIGVSGTGRVSVTPDTAIASIGVEITAPTLAEATKEASEKMTAVVNAIKAAGVDAKDIQTTSYNVYPLTNSPKEGETPKITAYRVSNIVTVKVRKIADLGTILDGALEAGANSVNSVFFTVNDPSKAQDEARTAAVKEAMAKAQTLATAAGVKVGKIISISDIQGGVIPYYRSSVFESVPAQAGGAGPVESGSTEIVATVEMHFEIAQ